MGPQALWHMLGWRYDQRVLATIFKRVLLLTALAVPGLAAADPMPIGLFTAVEGNVFIARAVGDRPTTVQHYDQLLVSDTVQTEPRSRAKALLVDDTLLALGEDSHLQVLEHSYDVQQDRRILVMKLVQGRVRVLVGRRFAAPGSRVELQTPGGIVSTPEGGFMAWVDSPASETSGVTNIGRGAVTFEAAGQSVTLMTGQSSTASPRRGPSPPELVRTTTTVSRTVRDTQVRERPVRQSPREVLLASGGLLTDRPGAAPKRAARRGVAETPGKEPPMIQLAPPAVISGVATPDAGATGPSTPVQTVAPTAPVASNPTPVSTPSPAVPPSTQLSNAVPSQSLPPASVQTGSSRGGGRKGGKGKD